jgi:predicted amidohydrolase
MTPFAIAGIQMPVKNEEPNIEHMRQRLDRLMHRFPFVQMVLFSELCAFGPNPVHAQELPGPAEESFRAMAEYYGIWLIPGSLFERADGLIWNTAPVINPEGSVIARYRKMFPFRPYEYDVAAGTESVVFDVPGTGRFGISICYDMWFPETTRQLAAMGAEVILHPTLTDTLDREAEQVLARANAISNQCYFFDINGLIDGGVGRSIIVDPTGMIIHQAGGGPEVMPVEVDFDAVRRQRTAGTRLLGQPLKSFRDRPVDFPVYQRDAGTSAYLNTLGPLEKPVRGVYTASAAPTSNATGGTPVAAVDELAAARTRSLP